MSDDDPVKTMYELYGRVEQLEAKVKTLETLTLPLQGFALTNQVNRLEQAVTALTERLDAMDKMGQVGTSTLDDLSDNADQRTMVRPLKIRRD